MLTKEEISKIKEDTKKYFLAEDGGMCIYTQDFPNKHEHGDNDNPVLFLSIYLWLLHFNNALEQEDKDNAKKYIWSLFREGREGLLLRSPGRVGTDEAHDNYKGAISIAVLIDDNEFIETIIQAGLRRGFIMENNEDLPDDQVDPHLQERRKTWWYKFLGFDINVWKWGGDIAYYKMARGYMPTLWNYIWGIGQLVVTAFSNFKEVDKEGYILKNQDGHFMDMLRIASLRLKYEREAKNYRWKRLYEIMELFHMFWEFMLNKKTKGKGVEGIFPKYFLTASHPNNLLSKGLVYAKKEKTKASI